ncbi:hypothetical protein HAX54_027545 [Datura stramonium]|uniref:RNase H type-1 domain-containing protein n=1 Tax=Datura stramonium TaxID=4076 RepID=A0ABS8V5F1_DATST|nr:hypothetical protein [Datura stramonium]
MNVDGCSKRNPRQAGGGCIVRNHRGRMIMAFASYYGHCSNNNNEIEARAILQGLKICIEKSLNNIIIESNSKLMIDIMNRKATSLWQIQADYVANVGVKNRYRAVFTADLSLPRQVRASLKQDKRASQTLGSDPRTVFVDISMI